MANPQAFTSVRPKNPDAFTGKQKQYWVEIQLVDEKNNPVANMSWRAENDATRCGHVPTYTGQSDVNGLIRIEKLHPLDLTLSIEPQALVDEMETRSLRASRDAEQDSQVKGEAEQNGYIWHYAVIGELSRGFPKIERRKGDPFPPPFHFPRDTSLKGFTIKASQLDKRHVIEICPFRAWELMLHHQDEYSMANAINLGGAACLAYADDNIFDVASITRFFISQCQDLSRLPQFHKGEFKYNALVQDVPYSQRYNLPVFMDTSKGSESSEADGDTQLFYVYNNDKVIISWRGTASIYDVGSDLVFRPVETESCDINKVRCSTLFPMGKVHEGFWNGYNRVELKFQDELEKMQDLLVNLKVFICGHSLGGALALIHAAKLKAYTPILYTYGMPRTFTRDAVQQLSGLTHYRHVNNNDPVPAVPPEANVDNVLYKLWGPIGTILGGLWSGVELGAWQLKQWGDCFWHHGNLVAFLSTTQSRQWKECKRWLPEPAGCITLKGLLPIKTKLYLLPALAEQAVQEAGQKQKAFKASLTAGDLKDYFPEGKNPSRGADIFFNEHFMTAYMPYINNKLLELIDLKGLSKTKHFTAHRDNIKKFQQQMLEEQFEIPQDEFQRNKILLELETLLINALNPTLSIKNGQDVLERFAYYGKEDIENAKKN